MKYNLLKLHLNTLLLMFFRSRNKFGMTVEWVDIHQRALLGLDKLLLINTSTPDIVILNLFQDLKMFQHQCVGCLSKVYKNVHFLTLSH